MSAHAHQLALHYAFQPCFAIVYRRVVVGRVGRIGVVLLQTIVLQLLWRCGSEGNECLRILTWRVSTSTLHVKRIRKYLK